MKINYRINSDLDIPIYQQLVDEICVDIKNGTLLSGQQLPTVQEMIDSVGVARGTVKRAYDELEKLGFVEKVQGRGTFVKYRTQNSGSRKEMAMSAIDEMLDKLEDMGFTPSEINIYLNLKIRDKFQEDISVKVALVECNPENLSQISGQLRHIDDVDLYSYTFDSIKQYPYKLTEDFDLIITTAIHYDFLEKVIPDKKKIVRVALRPSTRCLASIIKLRAGENIGIIGYSARFSELIYNTCKMYAEDIILNAPIIANGENDISKYLKSNTTVLVPKNYKKYFDNDTIKLLSGYKGEVIECDYKMDEGSLLYLESKIKRLKDEKTL